MKQIISVIAFMLAFILPMTLLFVWIFIKPHLSNKPDKSQSADSQPSS
jgi:hypothetical protein